MSRKPAFSLAYDHETALSPQMAQVFRVAPVSPVRKRGGNERRDGVRHEPRSLAARLEAIRTLTDAEVGASEPKGE